MSGAVGSAYTQMKTKTFNPSIFFDEILVISLNLKYHDLDHNYIYYNCNDVK